MSVDLNSGGLTQLVGSPIIGVTAPFTAGVDASGKYLYIVCPTKNQVLGYIIDAGTGALSPISGSPFAAGSQP